MRTKLPLLIMASILVSLCGCGNQNSGKTKDIKDPIPVYQAAVSTAERRNDFALNVSITEMISDGSEVYVYQANQVLLFQNYATDTMLAHSSETHTYGKHQIPINSVFQNGTYYLDVSDGKFQTEMTPSDYCSMYTPAILLDATRYQNITGSTDGSISTFSFTEAKQIEPWAAPEDATFVSARGNAVLDHTGNLQESSYSVQYQRGGRTYNKEVSVYVIPAKPDITVPDTSAYIHTSSIDAPLLLEQSAGYLMQAQRVTSVTTETVKCQVFGDIRTQTTTLNLHNDKGVQAKVDINTVLENPSRVEKTTSQNQCIRYVDGVYSTTVDGNTTVSNDVTEEKIQAFCREYLLSTILMAKFLSSVNSENSDGVYVISFTANEAMAKTICKHVCETLYGDATVLDKMAESYTTDEMSGYITIDDATFVPLSSGIRYTGAHLINGVSYPLTFETTQVYTIPSDSAYDSIHQ